MVTDRDESDGVHDNVGSYPDQAKAQVSHMAKTLAEIG
jgi:hypothetical protein